MSFFKRLFPPKNIKSRYGNFFKWVQYRAAGQPPTTHDSIWMDEVFSEFQEWLVEEFPTPLDGGSSDAQTSDRALRTFEKLHRQYVETLTDERRKFYEEVTTLWKSLGRK